MCVAVLFLLLVSGESLKWAKLSNSQQNWVSRGQVVLTTGVAISVVVIAFLSLGFVRRAFKVSSQHH